MFLSGSLHLLMDPNPSWYPFHAQQSANKGLAILLTTLKSSTVGNNNRRVGSLKKCYNAISSSQRPDKSEFRLYRQQLLRSNLIQTRLDVDVKDNTNAQFTYIEHNLFGPRAAANYF